MSTRLKQRARSCLDRVAMATGVIRRCERRMGHGMTILMYHRVLPADQCREYPLNSLVMAEDVFAEQMRWLAGHCRVQTVNDGIQVLKEGGRDDRPLVSLTFDDGYADNAEIAAPILGKYGLRATFFITTGFIESGEPMWFDLAADAWMRSTDTGRDALLEQLHDAQAGDIVTGQGPPDIRVWMEGLKRSRPGVRWELVDAAVESAGGSMDRERYRAMTVEQIRTLHEGGHEIAGHTVTHPIMPQLNDAELDAEIGDSHAKIQRWTGRHPQGFCYPNGDVDNRVEARVRSAGVAYACTTQPGLNEAGINPMRLLRLPMTMQRTAQRDGTHDALAFRAELCRARDWWRRA